MKLTVRSWTGCIIAAGVGVAEALRLYDEHRGHVVVTDDATGLPAELDRLCGTRA